MVSTSGSLLGSERISLGRNIFSWDWGRCNGAVGNGAVGLGDGVVGRTDQTCAEMNGKAVNLLIPARSIFDSL